MEEDEGRGYERKRSIESMRRPRLRESSSGGKRRQRLQEAAEQWSGIEGGYIGSGRGGAPLSIHQRR